MFWVGVPALAVAALVGGMIAEPHRARFLADATVAVFIFAGSAILALAIARLTAVGAGSGFDWRRNPAWVALLVVLVLTTLAVAVPSSVASPLIALGGRGGGRAAARARPGPRVQPRDDPDDGLSSRRRDPAHRALPADRGRAVRDHARSRRGSGGEAAPTDPGAAAPVGLLVIVVAAMILVLVLARLWVRRTPPEGVGRRGGAADRPRRRDDRRAAATVVAPTRLIPDPTDAAAAYVRLLADIDRRPAVRREPRRRPRRTRRRLRAGGDADLSLDLLAADYSLARFGGVALSAPEERRALERWRRLRRSLGTRQGHSRSRAGAGRPEA